MKNKEITIYDNYYSLDREKEIREFLLETSDGYSSTDEIPDERVWDEMDLQDREQWSDVTAELSIKYTPKSITKPVEPPKPKQQQASLWDMLETKNKTAVTEQTDDHEIVEQADDSPTVEEIADALQQAVDEKNGTRPQNTVSPLYSRYIAVQEQYPEHIAFMRIGDFYEAFDNDAETLSDELNLTLTGRDVGLDSRAPMVGFPYHASDAYIAKIRERHSVVVIEDGNVVTLSRTVKDNGKTVDVNTGEVLSVETEQIEELTESEMRQFDGDIQEPKSLDEGELTETVEQASFSPSSFDEDTAIFLLKLLGGKMDIA